MIFLFLNNRIVLADIELLPPKGYIETPPNGSTINDNLEVKGWFLDGSGVSKIEIVIDGKVIGQAQYGLTRLDVQKVFPQYQNANSGYKYTLNSQTLTNGQHSLVVRETGKNGKITNLSNRTINVQNILLPAKGYVEAPSNGDIIKGNFDVRGWFLDGSGVSKIEIVIDGKIIGQAQYGLTRLDVQKVFSNYQNANSGYKYTLNSQTLANGQHSLVIRETGKNGKTTNLPSRIINVQNTSLAVKGYLESPSNGSITGGILNVKGWFLDPAGVDKVEVIVDGLVIGQAQYGNTRLDVQKIYPQYQNANSGYNYSLNTRNLPNGKHTITVRETGKNGVSVSLPIKLITIQNVVLPARGGIDAPSNDSVIKGDKIVRGWILDGNGVAKVEILIDGKVVGQAEYGSTRLDVQKAYPEYLNANSGYSYTLNTKSLTNGQHSLTVRETADNGTMTNVSSIKINVQNPPTKGYIDTPSEGSTIKDDIIVSGWFLDGSGVSKVEVLIDGVKMGQAEYGLARLDVGNSFPEYNNPNSGYQFSLDTRPLASGEHILSVKETGVNGYTTTINRKIIVNNGSPYILVDLKKPANITANDIVNFFDRKKAANSPLKGYAQSFIDAQNKYGVNAQYLVAHAIWETGWGGSDLRNYKHNLYGYGAYDVCPFTCGYYFPSGPDSIYKVAYQVRKDYLDESGAFFNGSTLTGMNVRYATDQNWKNGIANLMESIKPYEFTFYSNAKTLVPSGITSPNYGRDIPIGQPYPTNTIIYFPKGITANVNISSLSLRSLPYVSQSTLLGALPQNTVVTVLGLNTDVKYNPNGTDNYVYHWYRVSVNGKTGWLYGQYLNISNLLQVVNISSGSLQIRTLPSSDSNSTVLTSIGNGSYLKPILSNGTPIVNNGWYNVNLPNSDSTGWVSGEFIKQIVH